MKAFTPVRQQAWHTLDEFATLRQLGSDKQAGLSHAIAKARTEEYGPNSLLQLENRIAALQVLRLFQNPIIYIFLTAAAVIASLGRWDYVAMLIGILASYVAAGATRAGRVKRSLKGLRPLSTIKVQVMRQGFVQELAALDLVPGDLLLLHVGDVVGADGRLIEVEGLIIAEAVLTGDPLPVSKNTACLTYDVGLACRCNMVFAGTRIAAGTGRAVVTATGSETVIGRLAALAAGA